MYSRHTCGFPRPGISLFPLLIGLFLLAGCGASKPAASPEPPVSLWGPVFTIGKAEQPGAPSMLGMIGGITLAWIGVDDAGIHHEIRRWAGHEITDQESLSLVVTRPYNLKILPASNGGLHLLWLDAEQDGSGDSRLFTAYINRDLAPERGPIQASTRQTLHYAAVPNGDGSAWAVWSGGLLAEPGLYAQFIDGLSRPRVPNHLLDGADWPALLSTGGGKTYLFWLSGTRVFRAALGDGVVEEAQSIADSVLLESGDRLTGFSAGADSAQTYVFWNVTRADGRAETWFTHGTPDAAAWNPPERLGIGWSTKSSFETGYNSGGAFPAWPGEHPAGWVVPAAGQSDILALAAQVDNNLGMIYMQHGEPAGYQPIVALSSRLIGEPALYADRDRHLYLAWAELTPDGCSDLKLTTTRRD